MPTSPTDWNDMGSRRARHIGRACLVICVGVAIAFGAAYFKMYLRGKYQDFFHFYYGAKALVDGTDLYASGVKGYIYPPMFGVLIMPLVELGQWLHQIFPISAEALAKGQVGDPGARYAGALWAVVNAGLFLGVLYVLAKESCTRFGIRPWWAAVATVAALGMAANLDKLRAVIYGGQSDMLLLLLVALAFSLERRRPFVAGVCLGLSAMVKYQTLVFVPYFIVRRRFAEAGGILVGFAIGALSAAPVVGWATNAQYLQRAFRGMGEMLGVIPKTETAAGIHPLTWDGSVSIPSALARLVGYPQQMGLLALLYGACVLAALLVGWRLLRVHGVNLFVARGGALERARERAPIVALEWAGLMTAILVFSPQATGRHFVLMTFTTTLAAAALTRGVRGKARVLIIAGMVLYVAGLHLPPGENPFRGLLKQWEWVGGASWCALSGYFLMLAGMLRGWRDGVLKTDDEQMTSGTPHQGATR